MRKSIRQLNVGLVVEKCAEVQAQFNFLRFTLAHSLLLVHCGGQQTCELLYSSSTRGAQSWSFRKSGLSGRIT